MIVPIYAAGLGLVLTGLSSRVIYLRRTLQIPHGNPNNDPYLEKAMRTQENFLNYVPTAIMLLWMCETENLFSSRALHVLSTVLVSGRLVHVAATSQVRENYLWRPVSMTATLGVIAATSCRVIVASFWD